MNASNPTLLRSLRGLAYAALLLTFFEACSGDENNNPTPPPGPAGITITGIALGHGFVGEDGASSTLACDYTIGVKVETKNWTLNPPGRCAGALQCGQLRVTLLDSAAATPLLPPLMAAANGVALDVRPLLSADPPLTNGRYTVRVELIEESGRPYVELDGGDGSAQQEFELMLPTDCDNIPAVPGNAGAGGEASVANNAGAGGDHASEGNGGAGGAGGDHAGDETAGAAGAAASAATGGAPEL